MDDALILEKFASRDTQLVLAKESMDKRLDAMNEFRDSLRDQAATFLTRSEYVTGHATLFESVAQLRIDLMRYAVRTDESDKASAVDRAQLDKRLESMNEFRSQLKDQASGFVTRNEMDAIIERVSSDTKRLENRSTMAESRLAMWDGRFWAVGILFILLNLVISYFITIHWGH